MRKLHKGFFLTHPPSVLFFSGIAASGGGVLPQRGAAAAVLAPARRLPAPGHDRRGLQRRAPLRRPVNEGCNFITTLPSSDFGALL